MIILAALALAATQPAPSTAPPPAASATTSVPIDPARLEAARAVVMATDPERQVNRYVDSMADVMIRQMSPELERVTGHPLTDANRQRLVAAIRADLGEMYAGLIPDMMRGMIEAYASLFTVAELQHMGDLMRDPVMQRMVEVTPELTRRMFDRVNITEHMPRMARMAELMSELVPHDAPASSPSRPGRR